MPASSAAWAITSAISARKTTPRANPPVSASASCAARRRPCASATPCSIWWVSTSSPSASATNVLLQHNPDVFPAAARQGYNLLLAGHTHGGQVTVEILDQSINPARFFTPYVYGLYRKRNPAAYVTRGIGTIGIPARIGAPPEISLLRLRKA